jgi:hypothetical protein
VADTSPTSDRSVPPRPARLDPGPWPGALLVVAIAAVIIGFGFGYRAGLGSEPTPTPATSSAASPATSSAASPSPPDIEPGMVSDRLALAFRATSAAWAICTLGADPTCERVNDSLAGVLPDPRRAAPAFTTSDWGSLGPATVSGSRLVLATEATAEAAVAYLASEASVGSRPTRLDPVRDAGGAWYVDLGSPPPGRYAVLFGASPTAPLAPFAASPAPWGWWTWVIALEVRQS